MFSGRRGLFIRQRVKKCVMLSVLNDGLRYATRNGWCMIVKYLIRVMSNELSTCDKALQYAAYSGHKDIVQCSVENGADVRRWGSFALQWAVESGHLHIVQYLKPIMRQKYMTLFN